MAQENSTDKNKLVKKFQDRNAPRGSVYMAHEKDVRHLIERGSLVYTWLDKETTDKDWKMLETTVASLTTTDISYNLMADDIYEVSVPDRVGLSPEAMAITRYMAEDVRNPDNLSPQVAAAKIYEDVQDAPLRLWQQLGDKWKKRLGADLWKEYVNERTISIPKKNGDTEDILVRHFPLLDNNDNVVKNVRVHEPKPTRSYMEMSYKASKNENHDYQDEDGRWRIKRMDKYNFGFRNTFFDNRALAAGLLRALFPLKDIYAMNKKGLGNHAADVFSLAIAQHFFSTQGQSRAQLGRRIEPETSFEKISAKLDLLMDKNTRLEDTDVGKPPGVRVYDGTIHNPRRGHNAPDYDNAKAIGVHAYTRQFDPDIVAQIEKCGDIDTFRRFLTHDIEDGVPTSHPIRFAVTSADDTDIYRVVPLIIIGSDDQHGKFNRVWGMRADIDYSHYEVEGKLLTDMSQQELTELIRNQRGNLGAVFHEIHLKRPKAVVDTKTGIKAGHAPNHSLESLRYIRDYVTEHIDDKNRAFIDKVMNAWGAQYPYTPPADDVPQPYSEEEIWTAMGEVKYTHVQLGNGENVRLPNIIRDMAQNEFKRINTRIGDTLRSLIRAQPLDWDASAQNALAYARLRKDIKVKLARYQEEWTGGKRIELPETHYNDEILKSNYNGNIPVMEIYATLLEDRLHLMDKIPETTRSYEVQQLINSDVKGKSEWQRIPFETLAKMPQDRLTSLKNDDQLRVVFEENPNRPAYRFAIRFFMENGLEDLLSQAQRDFYLAETAFYTNGPPYIKDPEQHRVMSVPKVQEALRRIRQNIKPGSKYIMAGRKGETGAHEIFAEDDMVDAILASVEKDIRRVSGKYKLTDKKLFAFGINPTTLRPLPKVKYEIPEDHKVIKIPDAHTQMPGHHAQLGHTCFVVPQVKGLETTKDIILEEETTGRKYCAAEPVIHSLPPREDGRFQKFYEQIDNAYRRSGKEPPEKGYVISCAELAPISRIKDPRSPAIHIDQDKLIATRAPRLGKLQRDDPLTGFVFRKYDINLKNGQKIRLRGRDANGDETGWEAVTKVSCEPFEISLPDLLKRLNTKKYHKQMDALAWKTGFANSDDMKAHLLEKFTRFDEDINDQTNILMFFDVEPVKSLRHWTPKQPRACMERRLEDMRRKKPKKQNSGFGHKTRSPALDFG